MDGLILLERRAPYVFEVPYSRSADVVQIKQWCHDTFGADSLGKRWTYHRGGDGTFLHPPSRYSFRLFEQDDVFVFRLRWC